MKNLNIEGDWVEIGKELPKDGKYEVRLVKGGLSVVTERYLRGGKWYGGCRPFTSNEVVTHYIAENR